MFKTHYDYNGDWETTFKQTKVVLGDDGSMVVYPPRFGFQFYPNHDPVCETTNWASDKHSVMMINACILHEGLGIDDCPNWKYAAKYSDYMSARI